MKHLSIAWIALLCAAAQAQLQVQSLDGSAVTRDAARLAALPHEVVKAQAHGKAVELSAVDLREVLRAAGIEPPQQIHGAALRRVLMAGARDGCASAFSWTELDAALGGRRVFLVQDGLKAEEGPLRLVVPADGRPTRWVRQLDILRLVAP
ncbi:hypothetical protein [Roseateles sp.]|uniref:hypothetical protein n=1 Tax=Roseateles sp. TaxID=1971397 RepID=UPI0025CD568C|nr:hypothetical protein [Roseateles sp.]MBV8036741.1 hypothetical protein [Roseateles sp.]